MSASPISELESLSDQLDLLNTKQEKLDTVISFMKSMDANSEQLSCGSLLPGQTSESNPFPNLDDEHNSKYVETLFEKHGILELYLNWVLENISAEKPLERLPCANAIPQKNWRCPGDGTKACGGCKLVSYCSKVCPAISYSEAAV